MTSDSTDTTTAVPANKKQSALIEKLVQTFRICRDIRCVYNTYAEIHKLYDYIEEEPYFACIMIGLDHSMNDFIVLNWAKLFGNYSEDLHVTNLFQEMSSPYNKAKQFFLNKMSISEGEYKKMHKELLDSRNYYSAHFDSTNSYSISNRTHFFNKIPFQADALIELLLSELRCNPAINNLSFSFCYTQGDITSIQLASFIEEKYQEAQMLTNETISNFLACLAHGIQDKTIAPKD